MKTLNRLFKQDKERFTVPKSVQDVIPVQTIWDDGIFMVGAGNYSKTFRFEDINYSVASKEDKEVMFLEYSELLNTIFVHGKDNVINKIRRTYSNSINLTIFDFF